VIGRWRQDDNDSPLVFPDWNKPISAVWSVVYTKGAYAMHLLRAQLGEGAFWRGLRDYTRRHFGASVETSDLQAAMERSSGRDLSAFFREWAGASR